MRTVVNRIKAIWKDESAQGATEYILLIVIAVGLALMFGPRIKELLKGKVEEISGAMGQLKPDGN